MPTQKRDHNLDIVRGLAMIGIVLIHVHSYFVFFHSPDDLPQVLTLILSNISRFSVPVFIFSAGYFSRNKKFIEYWKPKLVSVFIPYFFASTLGFYIKCNTCTGFEFMDMILYGKIFTPFYFIPLLFQFYALHFILLRNIKEFTKIAFLFISLVINIFSNQGYFEFLPSDYSVIFPGNFIFFFSLGIYLSEKGMDDFFKGTELKFFFHLGFPILLSWIAWISVEEKISISNHTILYPTVGLFFLYGLRYHKRLVQVLGKIGKDSLGIFLIHPFVIHFMHSIDPHYLLGPYLSIVVTLVINIAVPFLIWQMLKYFLNLQKKFLVS